jgi:hypothetical protein
VLRHGGLRRRYTSANTPFVWGLVAAWRLSPLPAGHQIEFDRYVWRLLVLTAVLKRRLVLTPPPR